MSNSRKTRVGIDTGGTFTDFVVLDDRGMRVYKCPSTPDAPERAILDGLGALQLDLQHCHIVHGSTVATNAVLERKGATVAYVTNRGLGDVLTLGRQARTELYNLQPQPQLPPVPSELCLEVDQRSAADGSECEALTESAIDALVAALADHQIGAVAVNLLFSYLNPDPEHRLRAAITRALPQLRVSLSSDVLPEQREYERGMATWLNASVAPLISSYLERLENRLQGASLNIMQSAARSIDAAVAASRAVNLLLSGPAGGLLAARYLARAGGKPARLLTFDMGGTSTDVALIDRDIRLTSEGRLGGYPVAVPMVDMHTIGAGGGSIATTDTAGMLHVGPESAGAMPGPACYGHGGTFATVTDANLVLGRLPPSSRLGGAMALDYQAAEKALAALGSSMGCDAIAAARAVVSLANEHMAEALRVISVQRGEDPAHYQLMAFGGAGGLHVCALAVALNMDRAVAPIHAGVLSALGMLVAAPGRELSHGLRLDRDRVLSADEIENIYLEMQQRATDELLAEGESEERIQFLRSADLRYRGQSHCLHLEWRDRKKTEEAFQVRHQQHYGHRLQADVEWVNLRLSATVDTQPVALPELDRAGAMTEPADFITVDGIAQPVPLYDRLQLLRGQQITGPACIVERVATTFIDTGWHAEVDSVGNILLQRTPP